MVSCFIARRLGKAEGKYSEDFAFLGMVGELRETGGRWRYIPRHPTS